MSSVSCQNMRMRVNTVLLVAGAVILNLAGSFCEVDVCGQAPLNTKILGGMDATAGYWPWQVSINIRYQSSFCGGSLINKDWVLSAANCFQGLNSSDVVIYLGRQSQQGPNPNEISATAIQLINHPNYDPDTHDNDIALLQLSSSVDFTDYIQPVCLAAADSEFSEGLLSWVTGWGINQNGTFADKLQEVKIRIVSNHNCRIAFNGTRITDNMLCAGLLNVNGKGPCWGDNGGPLVTRQNSRWIQSGVVSFGNECGDPKYPAVFTRVSQYQDWINNCIISDQHGFLCYNFSIFGGSSASIYFYPLSLTFSIISLTFCLFF